MERLNYNVLPLKDMVIRRLVSVLFKKPDILSSVSHFKPIHSFWNSENLKEWQETVEDKMLDSIIKLGLSSSLTKLLIDTVKPMGRQIPHWKAIHFRLLIGWKYDDESSYERLCWTSAGALDYRKTAQELIRSNVIDNVIRYQLACLYCLEDDVSLFWKELPEEMKTFFYDKKRHPKIANLHLEFCWPYIIGGEHSKLDSFIRPYTRDTVSFNQFAFQKSASMTNKAAAEYFFQKLTEEEKEASLIETTEYLFHRKSLTEEMHSVSDYPKEKYSETIRYLLSVMTPDQEMHIFQEETCAVMKCFVDWPLQDQFSEIADLIWNFLPNDDFYDVQWQMYQSWKNSGHYFQALLQDLFSGIPDAVLRKRLVDESGMFHWLLQEQDKEALEAIFRTVDSAFRKALVFGKIFLIHSLSSFSRGRWDAGEVCLREARLSEKDRQRLKLVFLEYLTATEGEKLQLGNWARFFHLLAETDVPAKRCSENETPTEAKVNRLKSEEQ